VNYEKNLLDVYFELDAKIFCYAFLVLRERGHSLLLEARYKKDLSSLDPIYTQQYWLLLSAFQAYCADNKEVAERKYNIWRLTHMYEYEARDVVLSELIFMLV